MRTMVVRVPKSIIDEIQAAEEAALQGPTPRSREDFEKLRSTIDRILTPVNAYRGVPVRCWAATADNTLHIWLQVEDSVANLVPMVEA